MIASIFDGSFPHSWTAEVLPNRPMILPSRVYVYPEQVEEIEKGALEVLVQPGPDGTGKKALPFLATCALGFRVDPAAPSGIWSMPDPDWICAVSGGYAYLIEATEPTRFRMIEYRPVLQVLPLVEPSGTLALHRASFHPGMGFGWRGVAIGSVVVGRHHDPWR